MFSSLVSAFVFLGLGAPSFADQCTAADCIDQEIPEMSLLQTAHVAKPKLESAVAPLVSVESARTLVQTSPVLACSQILALNLQHLTPEHTPFGSPMVSLEYLRTGVGEVAAQALLRMLETETTAKAESLLPELACFGAIISMPVQYDYQRCLVLGETAPSLWPAIVAWNHRVMPHHHLLRNSIVQFSGIMGVPPSDEELQRMNKAGGFDVMFEVLKNNASDLVVSQAAWAGLSDNVENRRVGAEFAANHGGANKGIAFLVQILKEYRGKHAYQPGTQFGLRYESVHVVNGILMFDDAQHTWRDVAVTNGFMEEAVLAMEEEPDDRKTCENGCEALALTSSPETVERQRELGAVKTAASVIVRFKDVPAQGGYPHLNSCSTALLPLLATPFGFRNVPEVNVRELQVVEPDLEEAMPFSRQISPKCRLVDCSYPFPSCTEVLENTELEFADFRAKVGALANEFFVSHDIKGMMASIAALGSPSYHDDLAAMLLRLALDRGETERRTVVRLLGELEAQGLMTNAQLVRGFEKLVLAWEDIRLDVPDAPGLLVSFLSSKVGLLHKSLFARLPEDLLQRLCGSLADSSARSVLKSHLSDLASFKGALTAHLKEDLFCHCQVEDFAKWLSDAGKPAYHHEVVALAGALACGEADAAQAFWAACLDREALQAEKRDLVLKMLAHLYSLQTGWLLDEADMQIGFSRLLGSAEQQAKEGGGAADALVRLFAGAVEQELLPAEFLWSARRLRFGGDQGVEIVRKAQRMTPMHSRRTWGSGDYRQLREEEHETILEYFHSHSLEELAQVVLELHLSEGEQVQFLRRLLVSALERGEDTVALDAVEGLLESCWSLVEVQAAFEQLRGVTQDLVLDFPLCREKTSELVIAAAARGLLDESYLRLDSTTVV